MMFGIVVFALKEQVDVRGKGKKTYRTRERAHEALFKLVYVRLQFGD